MPFVTESGRTYWRQTPCLESPVLRHEAQRSPFEAIGLALVRTLATPVDREREAFQQMFADTLRQMEKR